MGAPEREAPLAKHDVDSAHERSCPWRAVFVPSEVDPNRPLANDASRKAFELARGQLFVSLRGVHSREKPQS